MMGYWNVGIMGFLNFISVLQTPFQNFKVGFHWLSGSCFYDAKVVTERGDY
jgi:hypothetical protein